MAIIIYCKRHIDDLREDQLDADDWQVLNDTYNFLGTFNCATELTQGDKATIDQVAYTMDIIVKVFNNEIVRQSSYFDVI